MTQAPQSGQTIYTMDIDIEMPPGLSLEKLDEGLDRVRDELHLDIALN